MNFTAIFHLKLWQDHYGCFVTMGKSNSCMIQVNSHKLFHQEIRNEVYAANNRGLLQSVVLSAILNVFMRARDLISRPFRMCSKALELCLG